MDNDKNNIEMLDDVFEEIAEDVKAVTDDDVIDSAGEMNAWLNSPESEYSPRKFPDNIIIGATGSGFRASLEYTPELSTLYICSASLKACPYAIDSINKRGDGQLIDTIYIYGHPHDTDDKSSSRIDKDLVWKIRDDFKTSFKTVVLSGAFNDILEMKSVIFELYTKLSGGSRDAHIELTIDSRVRDESGQERTIADLVHEGYIKPSILDNPYIVRLKYDTLSPSYYARVFKGTVKTGSRNLFDFEDEEYSDNNNYTFNDKDTVFSF